MCVSECCYACVCVNYSQVGLQRVASTRALSSEEGGVADGEEERGLQNGQVVGGDADSTSEYLGMLV